MGNSLLLIGAKLGMDVRIAAPKALLAARRVRRPVQEVRRGKRRQADPHRGSEGSREGRGLRPHRRLGVDGRAGGSLGRADQGTAALPGQHGDQRRPPATRGPSSCTARRRSTTARPRSASRSPSSIRTWPTASRVTEDVFEVALQHRLRAGREPHAHHQGDPRLDPRRHLTALLRPGPRGRAQPPSGGNRYAYRRRIGR